MLQRLIMAGYQSVLADEEKEWLRNNCHDKSYDQLQLKLGIGRKAVKHELSFMGIEKKKTRSQTRVPVTKIQVEECNAKEKDYLKFIKRIEGIKNQCRTGKIGKYTVIKMYEDKVILKTKNGYNICPTYKELARTTKG